jgi:phospholipase D3/4
MARFGADRGTQLFQALLDAVKRGVTLRIVTAGDSVSGAGPVARLPDEVETLRKAAPDRVLVRTWSGAPWFGGGILHQKLWLFDQRHVYVGSANMDWKSLAQVMEMGVVLEDLKPEQHLLQDVQRLFDVWWLWATMDSTDQVTTYVSDRFQATLKVPTWSRHVPHASRAPDPFVDAGLAAHGNVLKQIKTAMADGSYANLFVASAPAESTARATRTFDEDALVYTIETAQKRLSLSVMDFTPYEMYGLETHANASIWWPALTDAVLAGVFGKRGLHVRLLISQWQSTRRAMLDALQTLEQQAQLCKAMQCGGRLEIKIFRVPGWQNTTASSSTKTPSLWPAYTRVNHAKYIVSDRRVNIGTSNMAWGYFYTTAGISVNTDHEATREAMENVFNRNWASPYAVPLSSVLTAQDEGEDER